jgi:hypothetical protein
MRQMMMALALLGALTTGAYAQAPASEKSKGAKSTSSSASHSVEGTVKSMDSSMLTITRSGKDKGDLMVMTNASTHKDGPIAVGSTVSVRYKEEGGQNIATAIKGHAAPASKSASAKSKTK